MGGGGALLNPILNLLTNGGGCYIHSIYACHSPPEDTQYFLCLMLNLDNTEATFHAVIIQNDYSFPKVRLHTYHS